MSPTTSIKYGIIHLADAVQTHARLPLHQNMGNKVIITTKYSVEEQEVTSVQHSLSIEIMDERAVNCW
ncbi:hypothetical protein PAAG_12003 [Paracoccidioides lutzii Pb01]|uniref:Uncharacterized protein n=1 Tax=Paracoccidioides lutzii (strain ATCC MYA-826 / Pb01) TaxID=502779 RepID=A0A0A2V1E9_PARBA|nr:hypothetical protein PAAG_12003 [Paracoccidioides lutzii Pb01]KGQ01323.1 hypothetical protein PAAG_12003 [Paracoccidioides lutzii Pb01]